MKCPDEGTLQAYLDRELPEARMRCAAGHLEACPACRDRLGEIQAAMGRVNAWLDALAPIDMPLDPVVQSAVPRIAARTAGWRWRWAAVPLAAALAASAALFLAGAHAPKREARVQKPAAPLAYGVPSGPSSVDPAPVRAATVRKRVRQPKPRPTLDGFVAFDDADPMQMGVVVRVMLPVSDASLTGGVQEIAADLMIGEDGRARAIRLVR